MSLKMSLSSFLGCCFIIISLTGCTVIVPPNSPPGQDLRIQVDIFYGPDSFKKAYATIYDNGTPIGDTASVYIDGYSLSYDSFRSEYSAVLGSTPNVNAPIYIDISTSMGVSVSQTLYMPDQPYIWVTGSSFTRSPYVSVPLTWDTLYPQPNYNIEVNANGVLYNEYFVGYLAPTANSYDLPTEVFAAANQTGVSASVSARNRLELSGNNYEANSYCSVANTGESATFSISL
jgi:hypothetical protein